MRSYRPEELFDENGPPVPEIRALAPQGTRRMGANPHANGGLLLQGPRPAGLPRLRVEVPEPGRRRRRGHQACSAVAARRHGGEPGRTSASSARTRPPRTGSARCSRSPKTWVAEYLPDDEDDHLAPDGRVMEILSEHTCQGWLEGYLLTGRHGLFNTTRRSPHRRLDVQPAREVAEGGVARDPVAAPIASLNYLLTSHVWRQDHNGFSHQDPGFIDHVVNKKADVIRVYLPPDANTLLVSPTTACAAATTST
jgi:xylulose-5-phosphate/fructose-6-phosphate phosphoketolase